MLLLTLLTICGMLSVLLMLRSIVIVEAGYWGWGMTTAAFGVFSFLAVAFLSNVLQS